jgi:WD40 repeat protein
VAALVAIGLTIFAFNQQGVARDNAATAVAEADARATQQAIAESETKARAIAQAEAESEAIARGEAEQQAIEERNEARKQAAIGLAGQAMNELNGRQPERAVPLAIEAIENYPYTWQARRALGLSVLNHKLEMVLPHEGTVNEMMLSRDGKRILTSSNDGTIRIWDSESGDEIIILHDLHIPVATWSPDESKMLIMGESENGWYFQIRDGFSGELIISEDIEPEWFRGFDYRPWSPDGERFVTAHEDGSVRIWDASSGEEILRLSGHDGRVIAEWSPQGDYILTNGLFDGVITMWNASTGQPLYSLSVPTGGSSFRDWSPSGDRFVTKDFEQVHIFESQSGVERLSLEIPTIETDYARFSPDGTMLITSGFEDGTARLWDAETGRQISSISGMTQALEIAWSPSGNLAAVGGTDGLIRIWDIASGSVRDQLTFPMDIGQIYWSPDENRIYLSTSGHSMVKVFKLDHANFHLRGVPGGAGTPSWSPDSKYFGASFLDGSIPIWDAETGEEVYNFHSGDWFGGLAWSPTGEKILTWNTEGPVRLHDAMNGELLLESPNPDEGFFGMEWSPDGKEIVGSSWTDEDKVSINDAKTLEELRSFNVRGGALTATWSPDGKRIAVSSDAGEASIRDALTGDVLLQLLPDDYQEQVDGISWTRDGKEVILFTMGDGYRFDATTGEELMQYIGHTSAVFAIGWTPDEELIYTSGGDGTVRIFEVDTGVELLVYEIGGWLEAAISPDGNQLLIPSGEGTVYVFPTWNSMDELVEYARECCLIHELTSEEREQFGLPPNE